MTYPEFSDPATLLRDAISFDGVPDDLVPSGFVESRIRQLNTISSNDNLDVQNLPYTTNTRDSAYLCSPACPRTRVEVSASPPVGHSYPGLRINDNHNDDNGVAWEVASTSAHMFNVRPSLRASRSSNSLGFQSPTRDPSRFRNDLVPSGFVESRIRQLNTISSNDNLDVQNLPYTTNTRDSAYLCSPACPRTRVEVSASPPVGHSYPGLRINDNHNDDNGVAWEVASTSAHMFNVRPSLRASRSSNSLGFQSPTRDPSRFRSLYRSNRTANEVNDTRPGFKLSRRSHPNLQAAYSSIRSRQNAPESSRKEQQDVLEMFDMYGVSRPEGWLSDEKDRQQALGMKTVQVIVYLIRRAVTLSRDIPEKAN
ncbi:ATP synthase subunit delta, mitochondrial [Trichoderma simmonsii]|uniref:ATP synthase subunit delta, mitochondrial n=1 Tax=Trichoderma simmonsii TaxID=1491479 RepID=A0A8G0PGE9_9HYPO|nr:ATP synthase subunit delta, mitochondrial [Trichoderma simmonsii]